MVFLMARYAYPVDFSLIAQFLLEAGINKYKLLSLFGLGKHSTFTPLSFFGN